MYGPTVSKAGSGVNNKTGAWRTTGKPKFLRKNCIACKMCVLICPEGCISGKEKNTYICDYNFCKGCANCVAICPKQDIIMVGEKDNT
jgi:pyruvate ferredoxin oxidoreductase delta subunit